MCFILIVLGFFLPFLKLQFKLIVENPDKPVASGLQVTAFVEYYPETEEDLQDRLCLLIEDDFVDIPLLGYDGQKFVCCCYYLQLSVVESLLMHVKQLSFLSYSCLLEKLHICIWRGEGEIYIHSILTNCFRLCCFKVTVVSH